MQIDFIIPTIPQRSEYLKRCLTSIENLVIPKDSNITKNVIIVSEGKSAGAQRNIGLSKSTGDYIYFIDDDDIVLCNFFCTRMLSYLNKGVTSVFFGSDRYFQPSEDDLKHFVFDQVKWHIGRHHKTLPSLYSSITPNFNPYPVGSYILNKDAKVIQWPVAYDFGEDIGYNKTVVHYLMNQNPVLNYIDETKHIVIRHALSTTWHPDKPRNMRWHQS